MKLRTSLLIHGLSLFVAHSGPAAGLSDRDFFYAGEALTQDMYIVKNGEIAWSYHNPGGKGEISDAVLISNGNVLFAHQYGVTLINASKKILWNRDAPEGCEIHTAQPIGKERVVYIENGPAPRCVVVNIVTGKTEREFPLPVGNPKGTHGQFRHARLTGAGTLLVAHMDHDKVAEYDDRGKEIWSIPFPGPWAASRLENGHTLVSASRLIREFDKDGKAVWELTPDDFPDHEIKNFQLATRLANGNTLLNNWVNPWDGPIDPATAPAQVLEVTPQKKVVWFLRSWEGKENLGPSTTFQPLDSHPAPEDVHFGEFR